VRLVVAVTDQDWFERLRIAPALPEVNFWASSPSNFRALQPGELFLFKLHAPLNFIVGGGIFAYANVMPCSLAWEAFGEANGTGSLGDLRQQIVEALPWDQTPEYLVRDGDAVYGEIVKRRLHGLGIRDRPTVPRSPKQNAMWSD
jgi:putative restriction endonuclease